MEHDKERKIVESFLELLENRYRPTELEEEVIEKGGGINDKKNNNSWWNCTCR